MSLYGEVVKMVHVVKMVREHFLFIKANRAHDSQIHSQLDIVRYSLLVIATARSGLEDRSSTLIFLLAHFLRKSVNDDPIETPKEHKIFWF